MIAHIAVAGGVTVHVLLYKRNIGTSISWMGIAWLSPFIGGLLYFAMGVNRVQRRAKRLRRERSHLFVVDQIAPADLAADPLTPLEYAIGRLTGLSTESGNRIEMLRNGDEAYPGMLAAIDAATASVGICSYIFRADVAGEPFIDALIRAHGRGVQVRVLIDGIGGGYFLSRTYNRLRKAGVPVDRFLHTYFPWRTPFLNLRNHRKLLVVDGRIAFTGGINIGAENLLATNPPHPVRDIHFRIEGPEVEQLVFVALHAISCARRSIRVVTPYYLPPELLTTALGLAAMRGVTVDLVVPEKSNHAFLDWARSVPLRVLLEAGCRIWLRPEPFDHSKLMTVDDSWSLIGSANWDTRSFRLNFELNVEIQDPAFAESLIHATQAGRQLDLATLDNDPLLFRLRNSAARLLQPYL